MIRGNFSINVPVPPPGLRPRCPSLRMALSWTTITECSSPFAPGTLTGPFFTNGAWTFESGSYTFAGSVGSVSSTFGYYYGNWQLPGVGQSKLQTKWHHHRSQLPGRL